MKGIFKRLFNKITFRQKPLGEMVICVEIENNSDLSSSYLVCVK